MEADFHEYRREVELTREGAAAKEVRLLRGMVKNLEEDLMKERTKNQRAASKRSQEFRQVMEEVKLNLHGRRSSATARCLS